MGDMVERALEETIPVLRSAQKAKLLTAHEISEVTRARRNHEYRLRLPSVPRSAFLEYASFETELATLLRTRAKDRNLKRARADRLVKPTAARANLVYSRAVKRFKGDVDLWLFYARHCIAGGSMRAAGKVLGKAIAMRPDSKEVWLATVAFHFDTCGDVDVARKIAQRALRALPDAQEVWREYFRLELCFLSKVVARRVTIQIPVPETEGEVKEGAETAELDVGEQPSSKVGAGEDVDLTSTGEEEADDQKAAGEHSGSESADADPQEEAAAKEAAVSKEEAAANYSLKFWQGGIPLAVFHQARRTTPMDVAEMVEYWKIAAEMDYAPPMLIRRIAEAIEASTANVHAVSAIGLRLEYDLAVAQLAHTLPPKAISLDAPAGSGPLEQDTSVYASAVDAVKRLAPKACEAITKMVSDAQPPADSALQLLLCVVDSFLLSARKHLPSETQERLRDAMASLQKKSELAAAGPDMSRMTLEQVAASGKFAAWAAFLKESVDAPPARRRKIRSVLSENICVPFRTDEADRVAAAWVKWEKCYLDAAETVHALTRVPPVSKRLLAATVEAMKGFLVEYAGKDGEKDIKSMLRELYSKMAGIRGCEADVEFWIEYAEFERVVCGDAEKAGAVVWKANKVLTAPKKELFEEKLCLRTLTQ